MAKRPAPLDLDLVHVAGRCGISDEPDFGALEAETRKAIAAATLAFCG
jgi:hypothetical protein